MRRKPPFEINIPSTLTSQLVTCWWKLLVHLPAAMLLLVVPLAACGGGTSSVSGGVIKVVAAENFWGSIASQIGGSQVSVTSIVTNPNVDPHQYESSTANVQAFAQANYVVINGSGYDAWAQKLLAANPSSGRKVLNVADLLGKKEGDNPHFWYSPDYVEKVADRITADLKALDPADSDYFNRQRAAFENALKPYHDRIAAIKQKFAGVKIGATESIFAYMSETLGLDLISPPPFMNAISQGTEPPINSVTTFQEQITGRQIAVLTYNSQTVTAVTTNLERLAAQHGIPVLGVSETVEPPQASFQDWQVAQLLKLEEGLNAGTSGK